jgi:hypothetical protein
MVICKFRRTRTRPLQSNRPVSKSVRRFLFFGCGWEKDVVGAYVQQAYIFNPPLGFKPAYRRLRILRPDTIVLSGSNTSPTFIRSVVNLRLIDILPFLKSMSPFSVRFLS